MIYTCTTNPSLDYYITTSNIVTGINNRSEYEMFEAGGKGVNVSIVLNNFHISTTCLGFLGGFTKDFYLSLLAHYPNIQPLFTSIKGNTRINVKVMDNCSETGLNALGPDISDEEFEKFKSRLKNIYKNDIFVLSGNIQDSIEDRLLEVIKELSNDGVKIVLDTDKSFMDKCFEFKPYLVKLNDNYVNEANKDVISIAKELIEKGVVNVMFSGLKKPSYFFNKDESLVCKNVHENLNDVTGIGDSMVGGLLYGAIRGASAVESFKYANAAALATSISNDLGSKDKIEEVFNTIEISNL